MPSQRQLDANRRNAQLSTGPRTPQGRAAVALNALTHGLSAQTAVLPNENPEEFQELLDAFLAEYQPAGPTETLLVEQMAMAAWRLRRMRALETGLFDLRMSQLTEDENSPPLDPRARAFAYDTSGSRSIETLSRYETRIERSFYRALHELERLRAASPLPDPPAHENNFANQTQSRNRTPIGASDPPGDSLVAAANSGTPGIAIMAPYAVDFAPGARFECQPRPWLRCAWAGPGCLPGVPLSPELFAVDSGGGARR